MNDQPAVASEMTADLQEAPALIGGRKKVVEGPVRNQDQAKRPVEMESGHVAAHELWRPAGTFPQLGAGHPQHVLRAIQPGYIEPGIAQRQRHTPGTARQFEDRSTGDLRLAQIELDVAVARRARTTYLTNVIQIDAGAAILIVLTRLH